MQQSGNEQEAGREHHPEAEQENGATQRRLRPTKTFAIDDMKKTGLTVMRFGKRAVMDDDMARRHQRQNGTRNDVEQITRHLARP